MAHVANVVVQSSKVTADLTDFPLLVDLSDLPAGFWSTVADGGGDIRVYKSDGTTELAREVVSCDTATDTGELWVKFAGTLSSSINTTIQIHADGSSADYAVTATYGRNAVWADYSSVWHLNDTTDSTGNGNTLTAVGSPTVVAGKIGSGYSLNGTSQYLYATNGPSAWGFTLQAWFTTDSASQAGTIVAVSTATEADGYARLLAWMTQPDDPLLMQKQDAAGIASDLFSFGTIPTATWHYAAGFFGATSSEGSLNATTGTKTNAEPSQSGRDTVGLGELVRDGGGSLLDGAIDEARVRLSELSANWRTTEYNNQSSPGTFYTVTAIGGTTITADGVVQTQTIGEVTLTQSHVLQPDSLYQSQSIGAVTLTQAHTLTPDALSQTQGLEAATLTQAHIIAPHGLFQAQVIEQAALTQAHSLTPDGLAQDQATGSPALTQAHVLTPDSLAQLQDLDQPSLTVAGSLLIDSLSQTIGLTTVELVQAGVLSVDSISQEQSLAMITLTQAHQLAPDGLSQTQGIEEAVLSVLNVLSIDSLAQTQGLDPATLTQAHVLQIDDLTQEQIIQAVSFGGVVVGSLKGSIRIYALLDGAIDIKPALKGNITIH